MELKNKEFLKELGDLYNACTKSHKSCSTNHLNAEITVNEKGVYKFHCIDCGRLAFTNEEGARTLNWYES